ncbi:MAG TPA: hypothetical protein PLF26_00245 [Blastocatellia bacterium]|nr:hypothetical protein [Blastocatellia bacterium]
MFHLYDVETENGWVSMLAVIPPDRALAAGLPSPAVVGTVPKDAADITPANFTPNVEFSDFLNYVIGKYGADDPALQHQASEHGDGWLFMVDLRVGEDEGEIQSEDIIGAFRAENGSVVDGSYRANPKHQLLTSRGLPQLAEWLQEKLVEELLAL